MGGIAKRFKSRAPIVTAQRCSPRKKCESVKRKQWSNESMEAVSQAVKDGMGVNKEAELHGIPKTTLKDRVSGCVFHGSKPAPFSYLTHQELKQLAE